jgi:hypothetical protein
MCESQSEAVSVRHDISRLSSVLVVVFLDKVVPSCLILNLARFKNLHNSFSLVMISLRNLIPPLLALLLEESFGE